jgi:hypothetical protein
MEERSNVQTERRVQPTIEPYIPSGAGRRISWSAVLGGVAAVYAIQLVMGLLGAGVGLGVAGSGEAPLGGAGVGAGIWFLITGLAALFAGGWMSARLAGVPRRVESALHGFLTWSAAALLSVFLAATALGGFLGWTGSLLESGVSAAAEVAGGEGTAGAALDGLRDRLGDAARNAAPQSGQRTAREAAKGASAGGLWTALALMLGALFGTWGGWKGRPHDMRIRYQA